MLNRTPVILIIVVLFIALVIAQYFSFMNVSAPLREPTPTAAQSGPSSLSLPPPNLPLFDDFEDGTIQSSWYDPDWEGRNALEMVIEEKNGALNFQSENPADKTHWGKMLLGFNQTPTAMAATVRLDEASEGYFGFYISTTHEWFNLYVGRDTIFVYSTHGRLFKMDNPDCCPSTRLIAVETEADKLNFFVDNELVLSSETHASIKNIGFELAIDAGGHVTAAVEEVWLTDRE